MDADQTMRQRALELAAAAGAATGTGVDMTLADTFYQFMKSGTLPEPSETDDDE